MVISNSLVFIALQLSTKHFGASVHVAHHREPLGFVTIQAVKIPFLLSLEKLLCKGFVYCGIT